ncbi:MAG: hypothetical protein A3C88_01755 [Candidatus Yanofskybacteria bacterium RIFCSPHIGHO2_02_FULL_50_12]|uniref:Uncharacterized protein n=1 Tax=Candidatus Yanofskybacteria bacterium RIFCSPHIGHO2_02_FULL_50_12 TaxID=1802685 RepID=A0A1F8FU87_9BACT|nr:MAG: hypothetical protein A3C88_01755 [Candidatus Yanofskybacteria bacterium RIFCSPHIGHO2_02_FULL_50_12]
MQQQTNSLLYTVLIVVLGLAAGYIYYSQWVAPFAAEVPPAPIAAQDDFSTFKDLKINFSSFKDKAYAKFNIFGELPVDPGITGKRDLFAP